MQFYLRKNHLPLQMLVDFKQNFKIEHRGEVCNELQVRARFCEDENVKKELQRLWNKTEKISRQNKRVHSYRVWKIEPMNDTVILLTQMLLLDGLMR